MIRRHLPEIEDYGWCPAWLRDAMTNFLQTAIQVTEPYAAAFPVIQQLLRETPDGRVLDFASGGGGPWPTWLPLLRSEGQTVTVTLSDLFPNTQAEQRLRGLPGLSYNLLPVSATSPPQSAGSLRTMFSSMHHFQPNELKTIFAAAQRDRVMFVGVEATHRSLIGILTTLFIPLLVVILMPRVKPRHFLPLLLTYLPPILPLLIWWDGFASTLRTYDASELRDIVAELGSAAYTWDVRELQSPRSPVPLTLVIGRPTGAQPD